MSAAAPEEVIVTGVKTWSQQDAYRHNSRAQGVFDSNLISRGQFTMMLSQQYRRRIRGTELWAIITAFVIAILMIVFATQVHAQIAIAQCNGAREQGNVNPPAVLTIDGSEPTH